MVSVLAADRVKSSATAPDAVTGVASTVTVTAAASGRLRSAVTVTDPPASEIDDDDNLSSTWAGPSSS